MSELSKLKKENKQLKLLLKDAVKMLDRYKDILKHPERLLPPVKKARAKTAKARAAQTRTASDT
ncbi:MAG TPA: hypothetical protein VGE92_01105 [Steroidobacteraceae bacterium]